MLLQIIMYDTPAKKACISRNIAAISKPLLNNLTRNEKVNATLYPHSSIYLCTSGCYPFIRHLWHIRQHYLSTNSLSKSAYQFIYFYFRFQILFFREIRMNIFCLNSFKFFFKGKNNSQFPLDSKHH